MAKDKKLGETSAKFMTIRDQHGRIISPSGQKVIRQLPPRPRR